MCPCPGESRNAPAITTTTTAGRPRRRVAAASSLSWALAFPAPSPPAPRDRARSIILVASSRAPFSRARLLASSRVERGSAELDRGGGCAKREGRRLRLLVASAFGNEREALIAELRRLRDVLRRSKRVRGMPLAAVRVHLVAHEFGWHALADRDQLGEGPCARSVPLASARCGPTEAVGPQGRSPARSVPSRGMRRSISGLCWISQVSGEHAPLRLGQPEPRKRAEQHERAYRHPTRQRQQAATQPRQATSQPRQLSSGRARAVALAGV